MAIEIAPGGLSMHTQDDVSVARPFVDVVNPQASAIALAIGNVRVAGLEAIAGKILESRVGGSKDLQC
jgi:hypothetical protein